MENALYDFGYKGPGLPYWDSTLDQGLPDPSSSAIWSDDYLGNLNGPVTSGFAQGWSSSISCFFLGGTLRRSAISGPVGRCLLMDNFDIQYVFNKRCFRDITCNNDCKFENDHAGAHAFVGGHMGFATCAASDPVFFMHHAFIDCIWEEFRKNHQESNIFKEYPNPVNGDDIGNPGHGYDQPMNPFGPLLNGHGIGKFYQAYYKCKKRPVVCSSKTPCGGDLLWCNRGRCMAKVRMGGVCTGLTDAACYCRIGRPRCVLGQCQCFIWSMWK